MDKLFIVQDGTANEIRLIKRTPELIVGTLIGNLRAGKAKIDDEEIYIKELILHPSGHEKVVFLTIGKTPIVYPNKKVTNELAPDPIGEIKED